MELITPNGTDRVCPKLLNLLHCGVFFDCVALMSLSVGARLTEELTGSHLMRVMFLDDMVTFSRIRLATALRLLTVAPNPFDARR
jgi:hypothetical protein